MIWAILFALLQIADWYTSRGKTEYNAVLAWPASKIGFTPTMLIKGLVLSFVGYQISSIYQPGLAFACGAYLVVCWANYRSL